MGCDIHLVVEHKVDGIWQRVLPPPECQDPWLREQAEKQPDSSYYTTRVKVVWFDDRNYDLFGILADVRNWKGFAGCDTGDGFVPISEPRGLPADLSADVRRLIEKAESDLDDNDMWLGDHSHSWLKLSELLTYDWNRETKRRGWVDPWNYEVFCQKGRPNSWSGGVSGSRVEHISNQEMRRRIDSGDIEWAGDAPGEDSYAGRPYTTELQRKIGSDSPAESYYTLVEWPISYRDAAGRFCTDFLPALQKLGTPEDVRIVFGFDS